MNHAATYPESRDGHHDVERDASLDALTAKERAELETYREWNAKIAAVCREVANGNLEARIFGYHGHPEIERIAGGLNYLLDVTDAFVREAKASLQAASEGRFHRRIIQRGLTGTFRNAAGIINDTNEKMKEQAASIAAQQARERQAAAELNAKVDAIVEVARAAAKGDLTREIPMLGNDAVGLLADDLRRFFADLRSNVSGITQHARELTGAAADLSALSQQMTSNAEETSNQASAVSAASEQVSANVQTVAAGTEEMSASIREISISATGAARVAREAVTIAAQANTTVAKLGESSREIDKVARVITAIAQQTKLLALNATIEAARAGEAGKGFAVVANEVKELAKETATATEDIGGKIEEIQSDMREAVSAIGRIAGIIDQINDLQSTIAGAVEEQTVTTNEMSRNVADGAHGTNEITRNISGVAKAAGDTSRGAEKSLHAARSLATMASDLQRLVASYRLEA